MNKAKDLCKNLNNNSVDEAPSTKRWEQVKEEFPIGVENQFTGLSDSEESLPNLSANWSTEVTPSNSTRSERSSSSEIQGPNNSTQESSESESANNVDQLQNENPDPLPEGGVEPIDPDNW